MADAKRDENFVPTLLGVSNVDGTTPVAVYADPTTHRLLVDLPGGSGTVTSVSVTSANGFAGTVATATSTPAITISTSITGILKGNGAAISAVTIGSGLSFDGTTLSSTSTGGDVVGPASSTDNAVARFDTTTGKLLQDGTLSASDVSVGAVTLATIGNNDLVLATGNVTTGNITIADGANGSITLAPNGSGNTILQSSGSLTEVDIISGTTTNKINFQADSTYAELTVSDVSSGSLVDIFAADGSTYLELKDTDAGSLGPTLTLNHSSASPAAADVIGQINFVGRDSGAGVQQYARIKGIITDPTAASEDGKITFGVTTAGTSADELELTGEALYPTTNDGLALGNTTNQYSDLFLASGGTIDWANGDVNITHASNTLNFTGATSGYLFGNKIAPVVDDGAPLGSTTERWSDLFLAEGGVINWDNGDVTVTQTGNVLAVAGGDLQVATAGVGTNADSVPTLSSTSTLTNKTLEAVKIDYVIEPASDDTYEGEVTNDELAGDTIAQWDCVYLDATSGRWEFTDADAAATAGGVLLALATEAGTDGNALNVLFRGVVRNDGWTWTGAGKPLYLSTTAGALTETAPSGTGDVVRVVGYTLSDDCIYFNPDNAWVVLV